MSKFPKLTQALQNKKIRVILIGLAAILLLLLVWAVFFKGEKSAGYTPTAQEAKLSVLLREIEGVESVTVMISERDGTPVSAVVVFVGEDGILVRTRIMEAAASALSLQTRDIHVYPANH